MLALLSQAPRLLGRAGLHHRRFQDRLHPSRAITEKKRQVGSLTKVATAMVVLDWAEQNGRRFRPGGDDSAGSLRRHGREPDRLPTGRHRHPARSALRGARPVGQHRRLYAGESGRAGSCARSVPSARERLGGGGVCGPDECAGARTLGMERTLFLESARHRCQRETDALFDRRGYGAA